MRALPRLMAALSFFCLVSAGDSASAQDYVGGTKCFNCHKLGRKAWQESHSRTQAQLSEPRAAEYAKATGGDVNHPKCVACHAPVKLAAGPAAVSCESCHGPAKGWLTPHQEAAFYAMPAAQWMGMRNLHKNPKEIARICVECHVLNDKAIAAAGHPVGASFDAGRDLANPKMVHWPSGSVGDARVRAYDRAFYAAVTRDGAPIVAARSAGLGGAARAAAPAAKPGAPAAAPTRAAVSGSATPAKPASSDEYADLGDDEFVQGAPTAAAPPKPRPIERLALPDAPTGAFEAPPVRVERRPPPAPAPPPPQTPARAAAEAPAPVAKSAAPAAAPPPSRTAKPRTIAEARGRAALVLADLIRQKKKLDLPKPAPPLEFAGPDGELLRLQDEVLALALETLRRNP